MANVRKQVYEEPLSIPKAERNVVYEAISQAVRDGLLWLITGPARISGGIPKESHLKAILYYLWTDNHRDGLPVAESY